MSAGEGLLLVFTNAAEGREREFNEWYDDVHIAEVLALPAFATADRYRRSDSQMPGMDGGAQRYLIAWEVHDVPAALAQLGEAIGSGAMTIPDFVTDLRAACFEAIPRSAG